MRDDFRNRMQERRNRWETRWAERSKNSHIWTGAFIILIGVVALIKASVTDVPDWVFSWKTFLIALGVFLGLKHGFKGAAWFILIIVGGAFLIQDINPEVRTERYIWPGIMIIVGLFLILRPRHRKRRDETIPDNKYSGPGDTTTILDEEESWSQDDFIDSTSIFGGSKKTILSKDFKGGDIVNIFGGTELNLTQADIKSKAELEITTVFGGMKLVVPSNWEVKSEVVTIFGGLEDKRSIQPGSEGSGKTLLLKGTVIFGGIDIKSF